MREAIVSPPDAISTRAVLQRVQLPRRLSTLLEGESLLNDATGLVIFRFAVAAIVGAQVEARAAVDQFVVLVIGGIRGYPATPLASELRTFVHAPVTAR